MPQVTIRDESGERIVELGDKLTTFGRGQENNVIIVDTELSRRHFQIERLDVGFKLVDLESRNGTKVNGKCVNQHLLQPGDTIEAGKTVVVFETAGAPGPQTSPAAAAARSAPTQRARPITRRMTATDVQRRPEAAGASGELRPVREVVRWAAIFCGGAAAVIVLISVVALLRAPKAPPTSKNAGPEERLLAEIRTLQEERPQEWGEIMRLCNEFRSLFPSSVRLGQIDEFRKTACRSEISAAARTIDEALRRNNFPEAMTAAAAIFGKYRLEIALRQDVERPYERIIEAGRRYFEERRTAADAKEKERLTEQARDIYAQVVATLGDGSIAEFEDQVKAARVKRDSLK